MYAAYFGLRHLPFAITPDPDCLYLSPSHQEALAHLLYGIDEDGGFVQLTGDIGAGKTTLIRALLAQPWDNVDIALCLNPRQSSEELVATLCDELGVPRSAEDRRLKPLIDALNQHLLATHAQGRRTVVIIDEAQALSIEVLEQVRLLTNLETHRHKLLRMILVGQPELRQTLQNPRLRQLAQRITARYHLNPLQRTHTAAYIRHRLTRAGGQPELFTPAACRLIHRHSGGIPRLINIFCDRALLGAYSQQRMRVDGRIARCAIREVLRGNTEPRRRLAASVIAGGVALIVAGLSLPYLPLSPEPSDPVNDRPIPVIRTEPVSIPPHSLDVDLAAITPDQGLRQLLRHWQLDPKLADQNDICSAIEAHGLRCVTGRSHWQQLQQYNRPTLLTLRDRNGDDRQVLLHAVQQTDIMLDGVTQAVDINQLQQRWTGEFLLFWQPPITAELLRPGDEGEAVRWLRQQLAQVDEDYRTASSNRFDAELEQQVRRFQEHHRLSVDGLVGTQTLLVLTGLAPEIHTPTLTTNR